MYILHKDTIYNTKSSCSLKKLYMANKAKGKYNISVQYYNQA